MKFKKSSVITVAMFLYVTGMAAYFLPRNLELSTWEKIGMLAVGYIIVLLLWIVLRSKERIQQKRKDEDKMNNSNN